MFLVGIFQWWYGGGYLRYCRRSLASILRVADFFSIRLLLRTLFDPFRQISAASVSGGFAEQLRASFDRLFSRVIGMIVRLLTILVGLVVIGLRAAVFLVGLVVWAILPLAPLLGIALWVNGVVL